MMDWRSLPKVCAARGAAANTKRCARVKSHKGNMCLGSDRYTGPTLTKMAEVINEHYQPLCDDVPSFVAGDTGTCTVGVELGRDGFDLVRQRFVFGKSGTPHFYGERFTT